MSQGLLRSRLLKRQPFAGIKLAKNPRLPLGSHGDKYRPNRLLRRSATGTRDARDRDRIIGSARAPRAFGHFARDRFAHRAVLVECLSANAEKLLLGFVAVR